FSVSRAIERQAQEVDSFRAFPAAFVRMFLREPTKLDQLGLDRLQSEAECRATIKVRQQRQSG
ncbi:MAG: hypothetical protein P4M05_24490, partial [Bradyrhizobium sp.]|nr:hypothetical protein [Bradyrhizobium sp.]